ncbi:MAG: response regulator [Spirochaetaceae bacterium]|jgi:signal transduction histidine kinase/DNA-binding NarL/FixJ family response regulator/HPt (histidine-containing phosphotransfer) domain-containing protein|nr:response regulator [Spirochaetaceae bacterium]
MNENNENKRYLRTTMVSGALYTIGLIVNFLYSYIHGGQFLVHIPIIIYVCLVFIFLFAVRYSLKKQGVQKDLAVYYQCINFAVIYSAVVFFILIIPRLFQEYAYKSIILGCVLLVICIGLLTLLMKFIRPASQLAFYIPALSFICSTVFMLMTGGNRFYFLVYAIICGFGAAYNNYARFCFFFLLTQISFCFIVFSGVPLLGANVGMDEILIHWLLSTLCVLFFLFLSRVATEKTSRSARAVDTFNPLMAATPNLIAILDEMNRVTYISKTLAELTHIEDYEMAIGRPIIDLFSDIEVKMVIGEIIETSGFYSNTVELFLGGRKRYFRIIFDKFPDDTPGRFIDMSDITPIMDARFEAEEAKFKAEEANAAKSAFLARMSHEIRTPMNAIVGMSELILREDTSPIVREHAAAVKQAGNNLVAIINDILDFSKIESGKMEIICAEYDFASLINDVVTIIRMRLREKPIYFIVNVDSKIPTKFSGDIIRMRQIILNLLSNASKYTDEGHILFMVEAEERDEESVVLKFEVSDTGIGIKQEDMGKLFGDFSRLDSRLNQGVEGSGLGLAITKNLCRVMGGDVTVESEYGEGSTFTARIPQDISDARPLASVFDAADKRVLIYETREICGNSLVCSIDNLGVYCRLVSTLEELIFVMGKESFDFVFIASFLFDEAFDEIQKIKGESTLVLMAEYGEVIVERQTRFIAMPAYSISIANILNGLEEVHTYNEEGVSIHFTAPEARVLIVDDIKTNLDVAVGLLAPYGMEVDYTLSGREALGMIQKHEYDIVLMDHMMPGMDGIETTQAIRAMEGERYAKLPIVALTANAVSGMRSMFLENGFNDYISKPIEITKLDAILSQWIPDGKKKRTSGLTPLDRAKKAEAANARKGVRGVDMAKGLTLTGGSEEVYHSILEQFCEDVLERIPVVNHVPTPEELSLFTIDVHALKSAAAIIGADEISKEAAALEAAGKAGAMDEIEKKLPQFCKHISGLVEDVKDFLENKESPPPPPESPRTTSRWHNQ